MARPLALELIRYGLKIWYDEFSLHIGDSLSASIDYGLSISDYGIVVISKNFFEKNWPQQELGALITKQVNLNKRIILPIWHNISKEEIQRYSPILTDTVAAKSDDGIENIAIRLCSEIRGIRTVYNFSSDAKLKNDVSSLIKSVEEKELLLKETEEELVLVILTKIYLIAKGYRDFFISFWPFSELLSSNTKEIVHSQPYRLRVENHAQVTKDNQGDMSLELNRLQPCISPGQKAENRAQNAQLRRSGDTGDNCSQHITSKNSHDKICLDSPRKRLHSIPVTLSEVDFFALLCISI